MMTDAAMAHLMVMKESRMRFVIVLLGIVGAIIIFLIGLAWVLILLMPVYVSVGIVIYIIVRTNRKRADLLAAVEQETLRQRQFNSQELNAWRSVVDDDRRKMSRRDRALRKFDESRRD